MDTKTEDRRVLRTRKALHEALISLILEKGYEAVTVQDILDRADVGRSTFYAHFADKEQLLLSGIDHLGEFLAEQQRLALSAPHGSEEPWLGFSLAMFEHAHGYRLAFQAMVGHNSGAVVQERIRWMLSGLVREGLKAAIPRVTRRAVPFEAAVQSVVGSFLAILIWWLDHQPQLAPKEVDGLFRGLVLPGVAAVLGAHPDGG
jgi:AcrR family transcriptional regulator